jgi:capreomycidine synthase
MNFREALLERWMRDFYFDVEIDIGSSGVQDYTLGELSEQVGLSWQSLQDMVLRDSRTLGDTALREAVARRWFGGTTERVIVTHGATEANYLVMTALLERGDEVVTFEPIYQQLAEVAEAVGCRVRKLPLRFENGFAPDFDEVEALVGPTTKMVVVNFPHNPTGRTLSPEEQLRLIEIAARGGAYLVWDAAFSELTHGAPPLPDPGRFYDRSISMGTLSKAFGLPGLRVGWVGAAPAVLERMVRIRDYLTLHLSPLIERLARAAIENADLLVAPRLRQAQANLQALARWIEEEREWVQWVPPQGGVTAFPRLLGLADVTEFCRRLAREQRVLLVPGVCFGHPQHVRLGFGGESGRLLLGLEHLASALREGRHITKCKKFAYAREAGATS